MLAVASLRDGGGAPYCVTPGGGEGCRIRVPGLPPHCLVSLENVLYVAVPLELRDRILEEGYRPTRHPATGQHGIPLVDAATFADHPADANALEQRLLAQMKAATATDATPKAASRSVSTTRPPPPPPPLHRGSVARVQVVRPPNSACASANGAAPSSAGAAHRGASGSHDPLQVRSGRCVSV